MKRIFEILWVLFEKSLYFDWPKSLIWRTLEQVMNIFVYGTFIMNRKKSFGQMFFWISCTGSKVPFWQNVKIAKMALLNPCMKFKKKFGQKTSFEALWKCHLLKLFVTCSRVRQIQYLGQSKYKLALFNLCMNFEIFFDQKHSFEALWKWQ